MSLELSFFLNTDSAQCKTFEDLAIWVKNPLIQWESEEENHGFKTQGEKPSNSMRD